MSWDTNACGEENQVRKSNCKAALSLAGEYCGDNKLKQKDVRSTELIDFEGIAKYQREYHAIWTKEW